MADLRKRCVNQECRRQFRPQKGATHRRYCYTCRPAAPAEQAPDAPGAVLPLGRPPGDLPPLVAAVLRELEDAERADCADGLLLLDIAAAIARGGHSATGLRALRDAYAAQRLLAFSGVAPQSAGAAVVAELFGGSRG
jgi:hypothetical protein